MKPIAHDEGCRRIAQILGKPFSVSDDWAFVDIRGGVVMIRGNEIHAAAPVDRRGAWITRRDLRHLFSVLISEYGFVRTKVLPDNETGKRFVTRLGFVECGDWYELRELKHAR